MPCPSCGNENPEGARFCNACATPLRPASSETEMPESVGEGRYTVRQLIGEGARKRVYAGVDIRLGRDVAVAIVKTDALDDSGRERIQREARAMARLGDHPHIVTVFDVGQDDGRPFIVSQLMPGGSVADQLKSAPDNRLPLDEALGIAVEVSGALEHAHANGVVHRDVKPANVWRAKDGTVLLGDFGLAAAADHSRLTAEGLVVGTVAYLAPEQAVGRPPDARSDLYSLGALLYELVCGRPPFLGDDAVTVISQHLNTAPVAPSWHNAEVSPALDSLILRLLAKDPAERPQSAAAVIEELARIGAMSQEQLTPPPTSPTPMLPFGRLVGRSAELGQLTEAFDHALSGRGRLVMVVGEPGIGKTRLVEELGVYASVRGATVCWGRCYEGELAMPYLPFVEAFRGYVRDQTDEELRAELSEGAPEVATLVSELHQRFADLPASPPLDGEAERLRLFEGVTTFLRNAATKRPVVLLLDDLHWADKPSLLMLQYLARNLRRQRVLLVGTYRDVELDRTHPLSAAVAALRHENLYERVLLRGLSPPDVKALIDAVDDQDSPLAFAETIHRETEGNPFFVAEILRNLVETGAIQKVDGVWTGNPDTIAENLPEGVREVIGRRLSRLGEDCNRMLTVGAAMPGGFSLDVIAPVLDMHEDHTLDLLDEALAAQVVRERRDAPGLYEFNHALIRQTLYAELSTPRRVRLHRQIAAALEKRPGPEPDLGELAYHWFQGAPGGDVAKAVDYARRAAERAASQAAHEETARFYDMALQALELAETPDSRQRAELLLELGRALDRGGETERANAALGETEMLARRLGDAVLVARAALARSGANYGGGIPRPEMVAQLEDAARGLEGVDDALQAEVLARAARLCFFVDQERLTSLTDRAMAAARRSGLPRPLARAMFMVSTTLTRPEQADELRRLRAEMGRLAEQAGDLDLALSAEESLLISSIREQNRPVLEKSFANYTRLAAQSRSPHVLGLSAVLQGGVAALEGRYADVEALAAEIIALGQRVLDPVMVNNAGAVLFPVWRELGRSGALESATRRATGESPAAAYRTGLAVLLADTGEIEEATCMLDDMAVDGYAAIPDDVTRTFNLCELAEVAAATENTARAAELIDLLRPLEGHGAAIGGMAYHGSVTHYLGILETLLGRSDEAIADLERAIAVHHDFGARPWEARSRYELARALLGRDGAGDRERAVSLLNEALDAANAIGMTRLVEQALATKLELQGVASSSPVMSIDVVARRVSIERPDLSAQASTEGRVTILFSDIEGYSAKIERLGDGRTQALLHDHNAIVRKALSEHRGTEVKSQGDGFMLAFGSPDDAVRCAVAIQLALAAHDFGGERVLLRIGIHAGQVIREADDFYGRTVVVAARVAAQAEGGEILVTPAVREAAAPSGVTFDAPRHVALKGLSGFQAVHRVVWQD
jgi:class 3 adenylate cyclase